MTAAEAKLTIQGLAAANRVRFTTHARERAGQRGASYADVRSALVNSTRCVAGDRPESWKVDGPDLDGDELTVVCCIEDAVVIITLF